jgi:hypothetical protein
MGQIKTRPKFLGRAFLRFKRIYLFLLAVFFLVDFLAAFFFFAAIVFTLVGYAI